jgi:hypothetical protein
MVNGVYVCTLSFLILSSNIERQPYRICFQLIMVILYPTVIQPFFNKLSPLAEGELRTRIESLASKLKFPLKHLYEIDGSKRSSHSNAYFFGLPWVSLDYQPIEIYLTSSLYRANTSLFLTLLFSRTNPKKSRLSWVNLHLYQNILAHPTN